MGLHLGTITKALLTCKYAAFLKKNVGVGGGQQKTGH